MSEKLRELADRVEAAERPDRGLDGATAAILGWTNIGEGNRRGLCGRSPKGIWKRVPRFTASLDAAMTLVPPNCEWSVEWCGNSIGWVRGLPDGEPSKGYAATPALALTAASLRALAGERP